MRNIGGKPIGDAHRALRITVTAKDIQDGTRKNPDACAVAVAAVKHIRGVSAAKVHLGVIYICQHGKWRRYRTSNAMRTEIIVFDRGGEFVGGQFDLLPVPTSTVISKAKRLAGVRSRTRRRHSDLPRREMTGVRETARKEDE